MWSTQTDIKKENKMDDKGFIFTVDAALMLIPIFIMIAAVSHINLVVPHESSYFNAQDALDAIYYADGNGAVVGNLSQTPPNTTGAIAALNSLGILKSFNNPYVLNYTVNNGAQQTLITNGTPSSSQTESSARRVRGNVTLILYLWH